MAQVTDSCRCWPSLLCICCCLHLPWCQVKPAGLFVLCVSAWWFWFCHTSECFTEIAQCINCSQDSHLHCILTFLSMFCCSVGDGSSLFKGLTVGQVFFMVVYEHHRPAIPEDCPEQFRELMTTCWNADPLQRYIGYSNHHDCSETWQCCMLMPPGAVKSAQPSRFVTCR